MNNILIRADGDYFRHDRQKIPKFNCRNLTLTDADISEDRTLELSVSSDIPYRRYGWFEEYDEVLDHTNAAVNLSRFNDGAMLLYNHSRDDYIGVIEKAWLEGNKLYNSVRFDSHELAEKILNSVRSGVMRNVSIGYAINEMVLAGEKDGIKTYRATSWMPFETSLVTVPADASVGVGRSFFDFGENSRDGVASSEEQVASNSSAGELLPNTNENNKSEGITMPVELPTLDKDKLLKQERERTAGIYAVGSKYNCPDLAKEAVEEGWSIEKMRSHVLDREAEQQPIAAAIEPVGMSRNERKKYSVLRAIGYAAGHLSRDECGLELEVSRAIEQRSGRSAKSIFVDQSELVSYRAPYDTQTPAAAGDLIETELLSDRFIEQLYNQSAFMRMGVTYLRDLTGKIEIPREDSYTSGYWVGEGQVIPEEEGTFDKIAMDKKKLAVITKVTFEMTEQASIDLEALMRARLLRGLALELDRTIGFGTGVGEEPLGIVSHPETKSIVLGANGAPLDWASVIALQTELTANNAMMGSAGYIVNARTKGKLQTTLDHNTGSGSWIWQQRGNGVDGSIAGYPALCSNQIPNNLVKGTASNLTAIFFGIFSEVLVGMWSGLDLLANPYSEFDRAIIQLRAMQLVDLQLTRGDHFCVATDVQNN